MDDRWSYVTESDLIINRGEECTLLELKPYAPHLAIYQDEGANACRGEVTILQGARTMFTRYMKPPRNGTDMEWWGIEPNRLTVGDLNDARWMLVDGTFECRACTHCTYKSCEKGADIWKHYRARYCPNKERRES